MGVVFSVVGVMGPIFLLIGVVSAVVFFLKRNKDKPFVLDFNHVFRVYFYLIMMISIFIFGLGIVFTSKSLLAKAIDMDFSYNKQYLYDYTVSEPIVEKEAAAETEGTYDYAKDVDKKDLITGLSCILVSIPVYFLHVWGLVNLEKKNGVMKSFRKVYFSIGLAIYSVISLIALPTGIYMTLQYFLTEPASDIYSSTAPGETISVAIAFVPIWIYYFVKFNKIVGEKE